MEWKMEQLAVDFRTLVASGVIALERRRCASNKKRGRSTIETYLFTPIIASPCNCPLQDLLRTKPGQRDKGGFEPPHTPECWWGLVDFHHRFRPPIGRIPRNGVVLENGSVPTCWQTLSFALLAKGWWKSPLKSKLCGVLPLRRPHYSAQCRFGEIRTRISAKVGSGEGIRTLISVVMSHRELPILTHSALKIRREDGTLDPH